MPRTPGWLSAHTSGTHLPSLLGGHGHGHAGGTSTLNHPPPPQTPGTPGGVSFSANGFGEQDPLASYFASSGAGTPGASGTTTPDHANFPSSVAAGSGLGTPSHLGPTASGVSHSWVEIVLDSEHVVLRGAGGDTNPARLSGRVLLHLVEQTNLKEVTLQLTGKAKVSFGEGSGCVTSDLGCRLLHGAACSAEQTPLLSQRADLLISPGWLFLACGSALRLGHTTTRTSSSSTTGPSSTRRRSRRRREARSRMRHPTPSRPAYTASPSR